MTTCVLTEPVLQKLEEIRVLLEACPTDYLHGILMDYALVRTASEFETVNEFHDRRLALVRAALARRGESCG